jgi:hypothetical protein
VKNSMTPLELSSPVQLYNGPEEKKGTPKMNDRTQQNTALTLLASALLSLAVAPAWTPLVWRQLPVGTQQVIGPVISFLVNGH